MTSIFAQFAVQNGKCVTQCLTVMSPWILNGASGWCISLSTVLIQDMGIFLYQGIITNEIQGLWWNSCKCWLGKSDKKVQVWRHDDKYKTPHPTPPPPPNVFSIHTGSFWGGSQSRDWVSHVYTVGLTLLCTLGKNRIQNKLWMHIAAVVSCVVYICAPNGTPSNKTQWQ